MAWSQKNFFKGQKSSWINFFVHLPKIFVIEILDILLLVLLLKIHAKASWNFS